MKIVSKTAEALLYLLSVVFIALVVLMLVGYKPVTIQSGSMNPTFDVGSLCFIHAEDDYRLNDIVTFSADDVYITHRIACDNGDNTYITKGDGNDVVDSATLEKENIKGKVIFTIPKMGYVMAILSSTVGKVSILVLLIGLWALASISYRKNEKESIIDREAREVVDTDSVEEVEELEEDSEKTEELQEVESKGLKDLFYEKLEERGKSFTSESTLDYRVSTTREVLFELSNNDIESWWGKQEEDSQRDLSKAILGEDALDEDMMSFWDEVIFGKE